MTTECKKRQKLEGSNAIYDQPVKDLLRSAKRKERKRSRERSVVDEVNFEKKIRK